MKQPEIRHKMSFGKFVLNHISRDPKAPDCSAGTLKTNLDNALDFLNKTLPDFNQRVRNKRVLDFGCGWGWQAVAILKQCQAAHVVGVDIVKEHVAKARRLA